MSGLLSVFRSPRRPFPFRHFHSLALRPQSTPSTNIRSMHDQSITVDAEHLMALKHGKRMFQYPDSPMAAPTAMARKVDDDTSEEEEIGFVPHNRGNKLKRRANPVTGGCRLILAETTTIVDEGDGVTSMEIDVEDGLRSHSKPTIVGFSNTKSSRPETLSQKQEVIQVYGHRSRAGTVAGEDAGEEFSDDDPYAEIKINELLSPLETSTDILQRPQLRKLFQSPQLQIMAVHAMAMIEREKTVNKIMSRVALILQGDDPLYPELGYGLGEGCSTAFMGMPDQEEFIAGNKEWKKRGEDQEEVQKTLSLLMDNINCSNQYIELLSQSRDSVNHVSKQKRQLWKKLKEKREKEIRRRMLAKANGKSSHSHRDKHA